MLGNGNWIIEWHNPRENVDGAMRAEDEEKAQRCASQIESLGNTDVRYYDETADIALALSLRRAVSAGDEEAMVFAENDICYRLGISLDETEQGLTENAVAQVEAFVAKNTSAGWSYGTASV